MTSLLRQIVAGPRAKHAETGLDLCYVTSNIIATSGPSQTYPQRAYRNPLDRLVAFLDAKHGPNWAIWEFRGEGTGYPDEAVYGRIRHYPWPDHHPPPFRLVPMIMASMRNWIVGGALEGGGAAAPADGRKDEVGENGRVVVVHCKAGKGRSGSMATSYLVAECGWTVEDALARFTERRMRPKFGAGVSIPSQLRWIGYVDRWTRGGKKYVDREVEIVEMHVWGLRHGVKVSIEGFIEDGKKIRVLHTFKADERFVVEGDAPGGEGVRDFVADVAGGFLPPDSEDEQIVAEPETTESSDGANTSDTGSDSRNSSPARSKSKKPKDSRTTSILRSLSKRRSSNKPPPKSQSIDPSGSPKATPTSPPPALATTLLSPDPSKTQSQSRLPRPATFAATDEPGGQAVLFKPSTPIRVPTGDVNVVVERRNRAPASMGLTMVTAVAHVWFNCFFEGNGPEQNGQAEDSGVFEIEWDAMDGIKGSSQKGTRAADRIAVVWRVPGLEGKEGARTPRVEIHEPAEGEAVPQMEAADWKGGNEEDPEGEKHLGLRKEDPDSAGVSKASSLKSVDVDTGSGQHKPTGKEDTDDESLAGVKASGPEGEVLDAATASTAPSTEFSPAKGKQMESTGDKTAQNGFIVE